ncbi:uncharacterized protein LOC144097078 [Amblyomma americanum]
MSAGPKGSSAGAKSPVTEGHDDSKVESPPGDDSPRVDRTFHLSQITHYTNTDDSTSDQRARKPVLPCGWVSLAVAGFLATVVGALIALALTHMRSSYKQVLYQRSRDAPNYTTAADTATVPETVTSLEGEDVSGRDDFSVNKAINDTQAAMFVLNVD